jgi:hypothetical protein
MKSSWELVQEEEDRRLKQQIREEILAMTDLVNIDSLIAEKIMGYKWIDYLWYDGTTKKLLWDGKTVPSGGDYGRLNDDNDLLFHWNMPNYSTEIAAAWEVVEYMKSIGFNFTISDQYDDYCVGFFKDAKPKYCAKSDTFVHNNPNDLYAFYITAPEAICKAALLAVMEVQK